MGSSAYYFGSKHSSSNSSGNIEKQSQVSTGDWNQKISLASYNFFDNGSLVAANGTWLGKGVGYPVNVVDISCWQTSNVCSVAEVDLSQNVLLRPNVKLYTPTTWNQNEIVLDNGDLGLLACARVIIRLDRISKQVTLTQTPVNSDTQYCKVPPSDQGTYNWHLGNGQDILQPK